jgi:hypothetical protein
MVSSRTYPDLDRSPKKNWVEKAGGLPDYIERIAKHIHYEGGKEIGTAISMAISQVRKWAAGGEGVSAKTQALASKAIAAWEALKAKSKARTAVQMSARRIQAEVLELSRNTRGPYRRHVAHTKQFGRAKGNLRKPASWQHPYVPKTQVAGAIKAKHIARADVDESGHPKRGKSDEVKKPLPASAAIGGEGRKEQRTGAETKSNPKTKQQAKKPLAEAKTTLQDRRNALERKKASGTISPDEQKELNRLVTKLKKAS